MARYMENSEALEDVSRASTFHGKHETKPDFPEGVQGIG